MNKKQNFNIIMIKTQLSRSALSANAASAIYFAIKLNLLKRPIGRMFESHTM